MPSSSGRGTEPDGRGDEELRGQATQDRDERDASQNGAAPGDPSAPSVQQPEAEVAESEATTPPAPGDETTSGRAGTSPAIISFGIILYGGVGLVAAWWADATRPFVQKYWLFLIIALSLVLLFLNIPVVSRKLGKASDSLRGGIVTFIVVPFILILVGAIVYSPARYQLALVRAVFLLSVCLLPAAMWYLFIATRKASLFNDFVTNLDRLGLLAPRVHPTNLNGIETEAARRRRIYTYLQKFEAVYGPLPEQGSRNVLSGRFEPVSSTELAPASVISATTTPVVLSTVLIVLGWLLTLPPYLTPTEFAQGYAQSFSARQWATALFPSPSPVVFAFLGAYFFSLQMLFRRYIRRDLRGSAYVAVSIRIIIAVVITWAVIPWNSLGFNDPEKSGKFLITGFVIGVFPRVAWQFVQSILKKLTGWAIPSLKTELPVSDLDGLTVWHEARLEEEDIENIPNMATVDLVDLLLNTRFPPDRIIDWVDQAILYTALGTNGESSRTKLREYGIRTATSLLYVAESTNDAQERAAFGRNLLGDAAKTRSLEKSFIINPNLELIMTWRGLHFDGVGGTGAISQLDHVYQAGPLRDDEERPIVRTDARSGP